MEFPRCDGAQTVEQEVARAKEQLEAILQNVADGIVVVDASDRLIYANDVIAAAFRVSQFAAALLAALQGKVIHKHEFMPYGTNGADRYQPASAQLRKRFEGNRRKRLLSIRGKPQAMSTGRL